MAKNTRTKKGAPKGRKFAVTKVRDISDSGIFLVHEALSDFKVDDIGLGVTKYLGPGKGVTSGTRHLARLASEKRVRRDKKAELRQLVPLLPEEKIAEAERHMRALISDSNAALPSGDSPFLRALARAPVDDEPETAEDASAVAEAREDMRRGRVVADHKLDRSLRNEKDGD